MANENNIIKAVFGATEPPPPDDEDGYGGSDGGGSDLDLAYLVRNDYGNAQRLIRRFGTEMLYVRDVGWHTFNGKRWSREEGKDLATRFAHQTASAMFKEAEALRDRGQRPDESEKDFKERMERAEKWAVGSGNQNRIIAMLAQAQPYLPATTEDMDPDRFSFNVQNGTLTLGEQVVLRPHDRKDHITRIAEVTYDPQATCPLFYKFLDRTQPDRQLQGFLQRYFGYALTGSVREQCLLLLSGKGSNGKSTLIELMGWLFGDYALTLPVSSLLHDDRKRGSEATPDIARLPGVRLAISSEPNRGARLDEGLVKHLTGGEQMSARHLGKEFFDFDPQFKLCLSFNNAPQIRGQDDGIWRRLKMTKWEVQIPDSEKDLELLNKLKAEASGVLNWLLDGFRLWREGGLAAPEKVRAATDEYREDSDRVGQFLRAETAAHVDGMISAKTLYAAYCIWCRQNAQDPVSQNYFGRQVVAHGYKREKTGVVFYLGLRLTDDDLLKKATGGSASDGDDDSSGGPSDGAPPPSGERDYR